MPNPSFEIITQCPNNPGQMYYAFPWIDPTNASSDLYNSCNANIWSVPNNISGQEMARTGQGYAGFATYYAGSNTREYIQVKLDSQLQAGKNYYVEFFVSLGDTLRVAANNMGAYFSSTAISGTPGQVFNFTPQINNDPVANPLTDYTGWTKVSDNFIATGNERYMTVGNFLNDANTDTVLIGGGCAGCNGAYYYADDFKVICSDCETQIGITKNEELYDFKFYPNPSNGIINLKYHFSDDEAPSIILFDLTGRKISEYLLEKSTSTKQLSESNLLDGLYLYAIEINGRIITMNKFIILK